MKEVEFRDLMNVKFGKLITNSMLEPNKLELTKGHSSKVYKNDYSVENTEKVIGLIPESYELKELIKKKNWAFDFPGWIGKLDFEQNSAKEIMIIGMEPHVGGRYYQATYGLRETSENEFGELDEFKPNSMLWKNISELFNQKGHYQDREFLERVYITDMAHFAIKGNADEMKKFSKWNKVRSHIAKEYLRKEVELINPKYIVSQGNDVAKFVEKIILSKIGKEIQRKKTLDFKTELPTKCKTSPEFTKYKINDSELIHLKLPHVGSPNSNYFWTPAQTENRKKRLSGIAEELKEF
jgi:hypothetical protein